MRNILRDVRDFHKKFGLITQDSPVHLTRRKLHERVECLQEELGEFNEACQEQDLEKQVDALIDIIYFALGTLVMLGIKPFLFKRLWNDVQRANMAKVRGKTQRGHAVDVCKPEGWVPPQGKSILIEAGYTGYTGEAGAIDDPEL